MDNPDAKAGSGVPTWKASGLENYGLFSMNYGSISMICWATLNELSFSMKYGLFSMNYGLLSMNDELIMGYFQ